MPEYDEGIALMTMVRLYEGRVPQLRMLIHVPNGGARDVITGAKLKASGVKRGVPDYILFVARGEYHGLAIELKRLRGGTLSPEQKEWLNDLRSEGWRAEVCCGHTAAWRVLEDYLGALMPLQFG
jgi:hypothetical protein